MSVLKLEAVANVAVGYGVAVATQALLFPLFGLQASLAQNLWIGSGVSVSPGASGSSSEWLMPTK